MQKSINKAVSSEVHSILEKYPKCEAKKIDVNITKERLLEEKVIKCIY